ncbi:hypothetical protein [Dyadobacter sandarakinus]|uniref:Dolichyl-phosphate-mannose-protein mannosyltransferase n=1 Tax=Dyadobacter sandarakinus TaxID=2747268 RepID=A0ABX7IA56_9BACT|nr:hypothetical protein [Dyadobacter sandarakinus]QRR02819.1 hypothetical protein HWI92_18815 [Dyadobacter sandarakinus]
MPKYPSIALCIALVFTFLFTLLQHTPGLPSFDDYDTTLAFIRKFYFENTTVGEKAATLFSRHNEHRILISKSAAALYYAIFHKLSFAHLVYFQNCFLFGFFGLMLAIMRRNGLLNAGNVLFAVTFLFGLAFWQVTFYYWGGIQHYTVFFFSFLSLFLLDRSTRAFSGHFAAALAAATIAVFTFGNGFLVLPVGAFLLFVQKKKTMLYSWLLVSAILSLLTFLHMPESAAKVVPFRIDWMARLFFTFLGSFIYINPAAGQVPNIILCMGAGLAVLVFWLWLLRSGYAFRNPLLYGLLTLPILTGLIISISRFDTKAAGGIAPRYMFFTASIPVLLFLIGLDLKILRKKWINPIVFASVVLWGVVYYNNLRELEKTNTGLVQTIKRWQKDPGTALVYYREAAPYSEMLQWAVDRKVVELDDAILRNPDPK